MKISKFARQNYILLALSGIFALFANAGLQDILSGGFIGGYFLFIFTIATLVSSVALVVRLWEME